MKKVVLITWKKDLITWKKVLISWKKVLITWKKVQYIANFSRNTSLTLIKRDINISAFEIFSRLCRS